MAAAAEKAPVSTKKPVVDKKAIKQLDKALARAKKFTRRVSKNNTKHQLSVNIRYKHGRELIGIIEAMLKAERHGFID